MITKGIIKSIDLLGNTCTVHIPFFETAGNDPIIETATVSNTPGSYNGYKVGDVVYVAFEDGSMSNPVVIGKLYLGTEKEKADPRGVSNVEESTASKKATLPADAALAADLDKTVPNTTVPYSSLSSIANNLNTLNTDVGQMDRDYGNRFKQVSTAIDEQGTRFSTEIYQTNQKIDLKATELREDLTTLESNFQLKSDEIDASVVKKTEEGDTTGLGWNLTTDNWLVYAKDSVDVDINSDGKVDEEDVKEFPLFKISRSGVEVAGDLKLSGYSKDTIITYTQTDSNTTKPEGDSYTWVPEIPVWEDGKYIWQKTSVIKWEYDKDTQSWGSTVASEKIVCLSGASAVAYWLNCSTRTHLGQQQPPIRPSEETVFEAIAMLKVGTDLEREDTNATLSYKYVGDPETAWTEIKTEIPDDENGSKIITHKFTLLALPDKSLEIKAVRNGKEYARETIVFSPVNTPVLVFNKDIGKLEYDSYGIEKINEDELATVSATVYLNNKEVPFITWEWTPRDCTVQDEAALDTNSISVIAIDADDDSGEVDCEATYQDQLGKDQTLTKTFTVLKNKQGKAVYKIDISNSPVSVPATEAGELSTETKRELPTLTLHSLTCYYGDTILPVDAYWEAGDSAHWNSISDNKFRIKYTTVNVTPEVAVGEVSQNFAVQQLYASTGSILYELYRGTEKVATNKFEVAMQLQGVSATSYGIDYSALVHRGTNQQEAITATAWKAFGTESKKQNNKVYLRYGWRQSGSTFGNYSSHNAGTIEIPVASFVDSDLKIEAGTLVNEVFTPTGESNIITYSPMNTPVLDLSNDSASLTYDSSGNKIGDAVVSCTAAVYLDGKILSTGVTYEWSPSEAGEITLIYDEADESKLIGSQITVSSLSTEVVEIVCTATIADLSLFKETITLSKTFTVSKQLQGDSGVSIRSQTTYYALISSKYGVGDIKKPSETTALGVYATDGTSLGDTYSRGDWSTTPPEHTPETIKGNPELGDTGPWKYWTSVKTVYSNGAHEFSDPIIDEALSGVYELAQGKTTSYYSELEPTNNPALNGAEGYVYKPNLKEGDCWFKIISDTSEEYNDEAAGQSQGKLYQWGKPEGAQNYQWIDIGGELVANKLTANYINAFDITAKKIEVPNLFTADGTGTNPATHKVEIAGFDVQQNTLTTGTESAGNLIKLNSDSTVQYKFEELESATLLEGYSSGNPPIVKPFKRAETLWVSTQAENKPHLTYYVSNSNFAGNINGYGVTKITFTKSINNLKFFIKTTSAFTNSDRIVVSSLNAAKATPLPVGESTYSYASTYALAQGALVAVEYPRVEAGDHIYVTYKASSGQTTPSYGGYIYLPVDARITVGNHFKVLADGTVYANNLSLGGIVQEETDTSPLENAGIVDGNAGQFTAARVEVIDKTDSLNYKTLLKADGREKDEYGNDINSNDRVRVGGFTVTGNTLTAGDEGAGNNITINSELYYKVEAISTSTFLELLDGPARNTYINDSYIYDYFNNPIREFRANPSPVDKSGLKQLEYASTNAGVHASFSVAKITFTQDLPTFDLYLYSGPVSGSTHEDYMWASVLNPSNNSCDFGLNRTNNTLNRGCKGLTRGKAGTIQKVTYENISKGNYIYVAYIKGTSTNNEPTSGNDVGYFYMPLNVQSSRLKIGDKFEVMSDGTTYASNLYLTRGDSAQNVQEYVAGELEAMRARFNQLTITSVDGTKTLFKADGTAEDDADRVQIGGFTVSDTTFSAGSGTTAVSLGTTAIMLGGTSTTGNAAAKFSVTNAGYLTAESGKIGGFDLSATTITSNPDSGAVGLSSSGTYAFWAGKASAADAAFSVTHAGVLKANAANITGTITADLGQIGDLHIESGRLIGYNTEGTQALAVSNAGVQITNTGASIEVGKFKTHYDGTNTYWRTDGPLYIQGMHGNTVRTGIEFLTDTSGTTSVSFKATLDVKLTTSAINFYFKINTSGQTPIHKVSQMLYYKSGNWAQGKFVANHSDVKSMLITNEDWVLISTPGCQAIQCSLSSSMSNAVAKKAQDIGQNGQLTMFTLTPNPMTQAESRETIKIQGNLVPKSNTYTLGQSGDACWATVYTKDGTCTKSDRNQKNTIKTLDKAYDQVFDALIPSSYKFNENESNRTHTGFIAQDVKAALINAGLTTQDFAAYCEWKNEDDTVGCGLRYEEFIALCVDQIQKLKKRVAEQDTRIAELEKL
jgi:predicted secreted protein